MEQAGSSHSLLPIRISTLGGWHLEAHRIVLSTVSRIASRLWRDLARPEILFFSVMLPFTQKPQNYRLLPFL